MFGRCSGMFWHVLVYSAAAEAPCARGHHCSRASAHARRPAEPAHRRKKASDDIATRLKSTAQPPTLAHGRSHHGRPPSAWTLMPRSVRTCCSPSAALGMLYQLWVQARVRILLLFFLAARTAPADGQDDDTRGVPFRLVIDTDPRHSPPVCRRAWHSLGRKDQDNTMSLPARPPLD